MWQKKVAKIRCYLREKVTERRKAARKEKRWMKKHNKVKVEENLTLKGRKLNI